MLQEAFRDNAISQSKIFCGTNASRTDERLWTMMSVMDDRQQAQHQKTLAKVCEAILADHRQTIHSVFEIVGLSYGTVQSILVDSLNMRRICVRFVPRLLSNDEKAHCVSVCRELKHARDDPIFISNTITGDETWVYGYDPETKQKSSQWKSANLLQPKKTASYSQQCQVHVDCFFFFFRHCPQGIHALWSISQWQI
jgi:hypothetical protein